MSGYSRGPGLAQAVRVRNPVEYYWMGTSGGATVRNHKGNDETDFPLSFTYGSSANWALLNFLSLIHISEPTRPY